MVGIKKLLQNKNKTTIKIDIITEQKTIQFKNKQKHDNLTTVKQQHASPQQQQQQLLQPQFKCKPVH